MPALPNVNMCLRFHLKHTLGADVDVLPRWFMTYTGTAPTPAELNTLAGAVGGAWNTNLASLAATTVTATECTIEDLSAPTASTGSATFSHAGTRSGGQLPAASCVVINYGISRRYRGGKPRTYWPFGTDTDIQTAQLWTSTFVSACVSGVSAFMFAIVGDVWSGGGTLTQVNCSFYSGFTVVTSPTTGRARNVPKLRTSVTPDVIQTISGLQTIGSQRRRNHGGG